MVTGLRTIHSDIEHRKRRMAGKDTTNETQYKSRRREGEDSAKHDRLRQGIHQVTDNVRYFPIDNTQFRLLKLGPGGDDEVQASLIIADTSSQHNLRHTCTREIVEYVVVSSQTTCDIPKDCTIWLSGSRVPVTQNTATFLHQHRHSSPLYYVWSHELCVKPKDQLEKGLHMKRMGELYRRAERVILWLGESTKDTDSAMDFMNDELVVPSDGMQGVQRGAMDLWRRQPMHSIWSSWHPALFRVDPFTIKCRDRELVFTEFIKMSN